MKIALASNTPDFAGTVPALYAESPYLLIVDIEKSEIQDILIRADYKGSVEEQDIALAREVLRWDCEGILCGPIERPAFLIIADEGCVTRYNAAGMTLVEALERMANRSLELIRDHIAGQGCQGEHKEGAGESKCDCGHQHDDE